MIHIKEFLTKNKLFIFSIGLYILITFPFMLNHIPWGDEAHAYIQAYFMNWNNWIDIVSAEGHPLLWFLILMPFAKTNWHYPYPMLIINYITCLSAIIVMWKMSPFNKYIKLGITFSCMFVIYFPIVARGYSLGILFLFLLASLYKNKLEHPFLYPTLVALTLNLNMMCGIGASWFGLIYFLELIQSNLNRKTKIISISILVLSALLFIFPFIGEFGTEASNHYFTVTKRLTNITHFFLVPILRLILYLASILLIFTKTQIKKEHSLIIYTDVLMLSIFAFFYPGGPHHFIFIFIYLILFLWIYFDKYQEIEQISIFKLKIDFISLMLIILMFIPLKQDLKDIYYGHMMKAKNLTYTLNNEPQYRNCRIFLYEREALIIPYLKNDIEIFNACNKKPLNWDTFDTHNCISHKDLMPYLYDKNKNTYLFIAPSINSKQFDKEFKIYEFPKGSQVKE